MVHGRVTDSRTGMPAQGSLQYFAFWTNPHLKEAPGFGISGFIVSQSICNYRCAADGRFELPVLPGPGILAFRADRGSQFPEAIGAADIHGPKGQNGGEFSTAPYDCGVEFFHLLTPLNPQPGTDSLALDLTVRSPATVTGTVRGPDGKPLSHYSLSDKSSFLEEASRWGRQEGAISEINGATFKLNVYSPADHQRLVFYQHSRNLGSFLEFTGEPAAPLDITLQPCATLQGRVVDDGGQPLEEVSLVISAHRPLHARIAPPKAEKPRRRRARSSIKVRSRPIKTDGSSCAEWFPVSRIQPSRKARSHLARAAGYRAARSSATSWPGPGKRKTSEICRSLPKSRQQPSRRKRKSISRTGMPHVDVRRSRSHSPRVAVRAPRRRPRLTSHSLMRARWLTSTINRSPGPRSRSTIGGRIFRPAAFRRWLFPTNGDSFGFPVARATFGMAGHKSSGGGMR